MEESHQRLITQVIPKFARELIQRKCPVKQFEFDEFVAVVHNAGINLRYKYKANKDKHVPTYIFRYFLSKLFYSNVRYAV